MLLNEIYSFLQKNNKGPKKINFKSKSLSSL